jgi:hypothetical protein
LTRFFLRRSIAAFFDFAQSHPVFHSAINFVVGAKENSKISHGDSVAQVNFHDPVILVHPKESL